MKPDLLLNKEIYRVWLGLYMRCHLKIERSLRLFAVRGFWIVLIKMTGIAII